MLCLGYQRVVVVIADTDGPLLSRWFSLYYGEEARDAMNEFANYVVFALPVDDDSRALAEQLGLSAPSANGLLAAVLNEEGKVTATSDQDKLQLTNVDAIEPVREFLRANAPSQPDARQLLEAAYLHAKTDNKLLLVQHSGAYCGPCVLLSRYIDAHHSLLDKAFVYVKLDERLQNGPEAVNSVRKQRPGGIPWMVVLDAEGNELITRDDETGNVGYPSEPKSAEHFEKMLRAAGSRLSDDEIKRLIAALAE